MFKILSVYIIKQLFVTFIFCMILFTMIAIVIDISEKTDDFVKSGLPATKIFTEYYLGFIPFIWGLMYPLFVFIAVIFVTSRMAARSEIIAILASGISLRRILLPYFIIGTVLAIILLLGLRYVLPRGNAIYGNFQNKYIDKFDQAKNTQFSNCYNCFYLQLDSGTYIGIKNYDQDSRAASSFFMNKVKNGQLVYNLRSNNFKWDTASKKWVAYDALERVLDSFGEKVKQYPEKKLSIKLATSDLVKDGYLKERLTSPELTKYVKKLKLRGAEGLNTLKVEQYRRIATPVTVLLLTFIGALIACRKIRGGSGLHLAIGIIIAALFILSDKFSTVFAIKSNFSPLLAAFLPNIVFTVVAIFIYRKAPR